MNIRKFGTAKGAALVEYGMLVGLIAVLAIVSVINLGGTVRDTFAQVSDTLSTSIASATAGVTVSSGGAEVTPSFVVANNALAAWSFTTEAYNYGDGAIGADLINGPFGTLTAYPGNIMARQTNYYTTHNYISFSFYDFHFGPTDLLGMTLNCDFGTFTSLPVSTQSQGIFNIWQIGSWSGYSVPALVEGETYNCQIIP